MAIGFNERYTASAGQTVFNLNQSFSVGTGTLMVFVNGALVFCGVNKSYVETDPKTITFNYPLDEGDIVTFSIMAGIHENFVATEGQRIFRTSQAYNLSNMNSVGILLVFVNGILYYKDLDYAETDRYTITFHEGLIHANDVVSLNTAQGYNEIFLATQGQTEFDITRPRNGMSSVVAITVNGILQQVGSNKNYIESSPNRIKFNYGLDDNDVVGISTFYINPSLEVIPFIENPLLLNKYGSDTTLRNNNKYNIVIKIGKKLLQWAFTSKYSPLYNTSKNVRTELGGLANVFTDEQVNYNLYLNSKEAYEIYSARDDYSASNAIPTYLKNWVKYKTCMDLMYAVYFELSGNAGTQRKMIGPMQIDKEIKLPYIKDMIAKYKSAFDKLDNTLKGGTISSAFVKGGTSFPYPITTKRNSF